MDTLMRISVLMLVTLAAGADKLLLEMTARRTTRPTVVEFSLAGLTRALQWCGGAAASLPASAQ